MLVEHIETKVISLQEQENVKKSALEVKRNLMIVARRKRICMNVRYILQKHIKACLLNG